MFQGSNEPLFSDVTDQLGAPDEPEVIPGSTSNAQATNEQWVRQRFDHHREMAGDYLRAVAAYPWLFRYSDLPTVVGHVEGIVSHFKVDGLRREDYLQAVASDPPLVRQKSAVVINNVEQVLSHYRSDGLSRSDYLQAALDQPTLFRMSPQTVIAKITDAEEWLAGAVTGTADCLRKAVDRPRLFTRGADALPLSIAPISDAGAAAVTAPTGRKAAEIPNPDGHAPLVEQSPTTQVAAPVIHELTRALRARSRAA